MKNKKRIILLAFFFALALSIAGTTRAAPIKVIIDTDPAMGYKYHDVDDGLMLLLALNSPELEILGITAAHGNHTQEMTYAKAREILAAAGREDIPCFPGARSEKDLGKETEASRFIAETVLDYPGDVTILAVGTMTNIATSMMIGYDPEVAPAIKQIVAMGGTLGRPGEWPLWAMLDLNYAEDLRAAKIIRNSGIPFHAIHSGLCTQVIIDPPKYKRMVNEAPFMREMIAEQCNSWYRLNNLGFQKPGRPGFFPWDVVALAYLLHPEWFHDNWVESEVDDKGWGKNTIVVYREGLPAGTGTNAPDTLVDKQAFWEWFFERI